MVKGINYFLLLKDTLFLPRYKNRGRPVKKFIRHVIYYQ